MNVAFYAPLKPPDHPVPSGDRQLARALLAALCHGGHTPMVASRFRSFDRAGDAVRQARLSAIGRRVADRLIARLRSAAAPPAVWFTYHVYHKAPDWLGPPVSHALGIPYVIAEASVAAKQRHGRWALGHHSAQQAVAVADAVLFVNPVDVDAVRRIRGAAPGDTWLRPFVDVTAFAGAVPERTPPPGARVRLVTVAMMREGAKLSSYRLLAAALARVVGLPWELVIIGDGPARTSVEAAFAGLAPQRVRFVGALEPAAIAAQLRASELFVWPAIDEAFGMVFIEAQACGVPVIAGDGAGVASVVARDHSALIVPPGDPAAFAAALARLVEDAALRRAMGDAARRHARDQHDLPGAAAALDRWLVDVTARHARASTDAPFR
jgi:glycosyltransferase involved in cell wall biosynthesis